MADPNETADLVGQIIRTHREHAAEGAEVAAVPGRVLGSDVEDQADELAAAGARLGDLLNAFTREPGRSLDAIAVFQALSRTAQSVATAAAELRRQEWFDLDEDAEPEAIAAWSDALGRPEVRGENLRVGR